MRKMEKWGKLWTVQWGPLVFRDLHILRNQQRQLRKAASEEEEENAEREVS